MFVNLQNAWHFKATIINIINNSQANHVFFPLQFDMHTLCINTLPCWGRRWQCSAESHQSFHRPLPQILPESAAPSQTGCAHPAAHGRCPHSRACQTPLGAASLAKPEDKTKHCQPSFQCSSLPNPFPLLLCIWKVGCQVISCWNPTQFAGFPGAGMPKCTCEICKPLAKSSGWSSESW